MEGIKTMIGGCDVVFKSSKKPNEVLRHAAKLMRRRFGRTLLLKMETPPNALM